MQGPLRRPTRPRDVWPPRQAPTGGAPQPRRAASGTAAAPAAPRPLCGAALMLRSARAMSADRCSIARSAGAARRRLARAVRVSVRERRAPPAAGSCWARSRRCSRCGWTARAARRRARPATARCAREWLLALGALRARRRLPHRPLLHRARRHEPRRGLQRHVRAARPAGRAVHALHLRRVGPRDAVHVPLHAAGGLARQRAGAHPDRRARWSASPPCRSSICSPRALCGPRVALVGLALARGVRLARRVQPRRLAHDHGAAVRALALFGLWRGLDTRALALLAAGRRRRGAGDLHLRRRPHGAADGGGRCSCSSRSSIAARWRGAAARRRSSCLAHLRSSSARRCSGTRPPISSSSRPAPPISPAERAARRRSARRVATAAAMFNYRGNGNDFFVNEPLLEPLTGALFVFGLLVVCGCSGRRSPARPPTARNAHPARPSLRACVALLPGVLSRRRTATAASPRCRSST